MHWFDTKFEKWVRTIFVVICCVLGAALFLCILVGAWGFDLDINMIIDWFIFTCVLCLGICLALVILKAIIVFFGFPSHFIPVPPLGGIVLLLFLIAFAFFVGYRVLGYPWMDIRNFVANLISGS